MVDFRNTVLIMTSNLGTEFVRKGGTLGFLRKGDDGAGEDPNNERIEKALKATFRPEFLNRIDEIIMFKPLEVEDVERIVDLQMREIQERVAESGLAIKLTDAARRWLAREGFDRSFGARPLRRALQKYIEGPLSTQMLRGEIKSGDTVLVDWNEETGVSLRSEAATPIQIKQDVAPTTWPPSCKKGRPNLGRLFLDSQPVGPVRSICDSRENKAFQKTRVGVSGRHTITTTGTISRLP